MADQEDTPTAFGWRIAIVVALGAVWRYGYLFVVKRDQQLLLNDSLYYSWQAGGLVNGTYFKDIFGVREAAEHGPLTSIVLAPFSSGSDVVLQQRLVTATLGVVTVGLIGLLARRIAQRSGWSDRTSDRIGLCAAAIAAAYPNLWINDGLVMSESLAGVLVCLILLMMIRLSDAFVMAPDPAAATTVEHPLTQPVTERRRILIASSLGALIGLGALTRSELIAAAPIAALVVLRWRRPWRESLRVIASIAIATAVVIGPWVAYNQSRFDESVTLTTNDGTTLIGSNCPETYSSRALGGWSLFCVLEVQGPPGIDDSTRAKLQREEAIRYAREHLTRLPIVAIARVARTADLYAVGNLVHQDVGEEKAEWAAWSGVVSWYVLAPLSVIGLVRIRRRERDILLVPVVIVAITSLAFYGSHRLRVSLEPVVVIGAAAAIVTSWDARRMTPSAGAELQ